MQYVSMIPAGFEGIVHRRCAPDGRALPGMLIHDAPRVEPLAPYSRASYALVAEVPDDLDSAVAAVIARPETEAALRRLRLPADSSFKIWVSHENRTVPPLRYGIQALERLIASLSGCRLELERPEHEFLLLRRSEGTTYLLHKVARPREERLRGALDRCVCRVMCLLAELSPGSVVLDPFAGSGRIAQVAREAAAVVYANDLAAASVRGRAGIAWSRADFLASAERFAAYGIDRIVTDPPWGFHDDIGDRGDFYRRMFAAMRQTLRPQGLAVVLAPNLGRPPEVDGLELRETHPVLIHGKKAFLLKLRNS